MLMGRIGKTIRQLRLTSVMKIQSETFVNVLLSKVFSLLSSVKNSRLHHANESLMERMKLD